MEVHTPSDATLSDKSRSLKSQKRLSSRPSQKNIRAKCKTEKSVMRKRNDIVVKYGGHHNVTPKCLLPVNPSTRNDYISLTQMEIRSNYELSFFGNLSASILQSNIHTQSIIQLSQTSQRSSIFKDTEHSSDEDEIVSNPWEDDDIVAQPKIEIPNRVDIILQETSVIFLLEINSTTEVKGTERAFLVEVDNDKYEFLTTGKGRNRKTTNAEIQTHISLFKTRATLAKRPSKHSDCTFASEWDMLDTLEEEKLKEKKSSKELLDMDETKKYETEDEQMERLCRNPNFQYALLVMERSLANNVYKNQQKRFKSIIVQDPFRPNIEYNYGIDLLWTFQSKMTRGHPIVCMQWHPVNPDILACGYGKFLYSDIKKGTIFCWNIKNPTQPEREYYFENPVTSLSFSNYEPNLLAVGLYNGSVALLDIASKDVFLVMITKPSDKMSYEPIWDLDWFQPNEFNINDNHIITVCEDGSICSYVGTKSNDFLGVLMLRTYMAESKMKGVYKNKQCISNEIPLTKKASALNLRKHPIEPTVFFVGTGQGSVHKCSENYQNAHIDVFMAHCGPVYGIHFSHFCTKLFLTCGADSCVRLWIEEIKEPLVTLLVVNSSDPIDGAEWCPSNSTIIANICNTSIILWDLQRKTYKPASEHQNPTNCRNTVLKFNPTGKNLAVGDIEGHLHIFSLVDLPFPPFYPAKMLEQVMYKNMAIKPNIYNKVKKFGFMYDRGKSYKIV